MTDFRDRIAEVLKQHQRTTGMAAAMGWTCQCGFYASGVSLQEQIVRHQTGALIAAGVVADPAEVEEMRVEMQQYSRELLAAAAERDRYRAALHDIAALHKPYRNCSQGCQWEHCSCSSHAFPCATAAVLARHGIETAALELPPNSPTGTVGHIDTEEPQP